MSTVWEERAGRSRRSEGSGTLALGGGLGCIEQRSTCRLVVVSDRLTWTEHNIASVASGGNDTMAPAVATTPDALRSPLVRSASETRAGLRYGSRATGRIGSAHRRPFLPDHKSMTWHGTHDCRQADRVLLVGLASLLTPPSGTLRGVAEPSIRDSIRRAIGH